MLNFRIETIVESVCCEIKEFALYLLTANWCSWMLVFCLSVLPSACYSSCTACYTSVVPNIFGLVDWGGGMVLCKWCSSICTRGERVHLPLTQIEVYVLAHAPATALIHLLHVLVLNQLRPGSGSLPVDWGSLL